MRGGGDCVSNHRQQIAVALDQLRDGLVPVVEAAMSRRYGDRWEEMATAPMRLGRHGAGEARAASKAKPPSAEIPVWDAHLLLAVMWDHWNDAFRDSLGVLERCYVSELREYRNRWAHQMAFDAETTLRVLDTIERLLTAANQTEPARRVALVREEVVLQLAGRIQSTAIANFRKRRRLLVETTIFLVCGISIAVAITTLMIPRQPAAGLLLLGFVIATFSYLVFERWRIRKPIHGVHECDYCHKVIYTAVCPYCEPAQVPRVSRLGDSREHAMLDLDEAGETGRGVARTGQSSMREKAIVGR